MCGRSVWASSRLIFPSCFQKKQKQNERGLWEVKKRIYPRWRQNKERKEIIEWYTFTMGLFFLILFNVWV